jgi:hypothetical protein
MADQQMPIREPRKKEENATRPPLPAFTRETAVQKVRAAEDAWNSRDPEKVALVYTTDSHLRKPRRVSEGTRGNRSISEAQVGQRTGLPADQRALGLQHKPHCCAVRL